METVKRFPAGSITNIQIKSTLSQVNVVSGNEHEIVLRWTDTKRRITSAALDGETLTVKDHAEVALYGIVGLIWLKENKELTLELPQEFHGAVQIESKDECIRILGVSCPGILQAKTLVAAIEVSATDVQSCDFSSQSGAISLHGVTSKEGISATTISGSIECLCGEKADSYLLDCHSEHGKCSLPISIGRGEKYLRLRSKLGTISVNFTDGN